MTDRELLELAAKAAGLTYRDDLWNGSRIQRADKFWEEWNPLEDDGDAFRLAVRLGMVVHTTGNDFVGAHCPHLDFNSVSEQPSGDKPSAVRRAIVRLAAEIGARRAAQRP